MSKTEKIKPSPEVPMLKETWHEFQKAGMLWWVNRILHMFGWVLVLDVRTDNTMEVYPARTIYRGFTPEVEEKGFIQVTKFLKDNIADLNKEVKM